MLHTRVVVRDNEITTSPSVTLEEPEQAEDALSEWSPPLTRDLLRVGDQQFRVHRHGGGLVSVTAVVAPSVRVAPNAIVRDYAIVVGAVRLFGQSVIEGNAVVSGGATLRDRACIGGEAIVRGQVNLAHHARIDGDARVNGGVLLQHYAHISRGVLSGGMTVN